MSIFSKKMTTDQVTEVLINLFNVSYESLLKGLKEIIDVDITIDKEQYKEILVIPMIAITRAIMVTFGDSQITKDLLGKFQKSLFNYFETEEEKNYFSQIFWLRTDEYSKIITPNNKNLDIQFGQIFCNHFFRKEEDGSHLAIMTAVGLIFLTEFKEAKKILQEISSRYIIT